MNPRASDREGSNGSPPDPDTRHPDPNTRHPDPDIRHPDPDIHSQGPATARRSIVAIVLFTAVLIAGVLGEADRDHARWFGWEGPECPLRTTLGDRICPGCGLSRATVLTIHGRFRDAFQTHPAGWLIPPFAIAGLWLHSDVLRRRAITSRHHRWRRIGRWAFLTALLVATAIRIWA